MYLLGKELLNKNLGIIAAILTTINFYAIAYSQEARVYSFAFLFTILSFLFFIKLIKRPSRRNAILYSFFTLCLLYSHYYSLFVGMAQGALAILFILQEKGKERKSLFNYFLISAAIIIVGYLPWVPFFLQTSKITSTWIQVSHDFLQIYFYEYFGNSDLLNPLLVFLVFMYFLKVGLSAEFSFNQKLKENSLVFSFVLFLFWIFITLLIPYLRSLLVVPMLYSRYTIVVLPAIILILAYSIELFKRPILQSVLVGLFVILSLINSFFVRRYYSAPAKTQFREMTQYVVAENSSNFPIINERTAWHQEFYLKKLKSKADVFIGKKEYLIDSILSKHPGKYNVDGFWLVGAHNEPYLADPKRKELDTAFTLLEERKFLDAWAQLFISTRTVKNIFTIIHYYDFTDGAVLQDNQELAMWNGSVHTKPVLLKQGKNKFIISARGTQAANSFPHINIYCNGKKIGSCFLAAESANKNFNFEIKEDETGIFTIEMDNDIVLNSYEDRNVFIDRILIQHLLP